jgi:hypothetical protein
MGDMDPDGRPCIASHGDYRTCSRKVDVLVLLPRPRDFQCLLDTKLETTRQWQNMPMQVAANLST